MFNEKKTISLLRKSVIPLLKKELNESKESHFADRCSRCSLSMTRALCNAAPTRLLVTIIYLVLLTFNFNLLNFNHFVKLTRSSFIFSKQSAKFSPAIERRVSSANRLISEYFIEPMISLIYGDVWLRFGSE
jgi:hypothetical protein